MRFSGLIAALGLLLLVLSVITLSLALVLSFAISIGWFLTLFLPFTLFEGSVLGLMATIVVAIFWYNILNTDTGFGLGQFDDDEYEYEEEFDDYKHIPTSQFYKTATDKTWDAWLRHQLADDIYIEFQDVPQTVTPMNDAQIRALAIRLADITMSILQAKTTRAKQLKVSMTGLKKQMKKMGQQPYDDDILKVATSAVNADIEYYYDEILLVVRSKLWNSACDMFENSNIKIF